MGRERETSKNGEREIAQRKKKKEVPSGAACIFSSRLFSSEGLFLKSSIAVKHVKRQGLFAAQRREGRPEPLWLSGIILLMHTNGGGSGRLCGGQTATSGHCCTLLCHHHFVSALEL